MGIDISAKLMYGDFYSDLVDGMSDEDRQFVDDDLDSGDLDYSSPYYDSSRDEWFVGYDLSECFDYGGVHLFITELKEVEDRFVKRFGKVGSVQARADVY